MHCMRATRLVELKLFWCYTDSLMSNTALQKPLNSNMAISKTGIDHISKDEGFSALPYNDIAGNCTVGIGILLSYSPCTEQQMKTKYNLANLNATFHDRLEEAQKYVRFYVRESSLSQNQFDSLTSFVFNVGVGNAKGVLAFANKGEFNNVEKEMGKFVYITEKGKDGKPSKKKFSNGLANRRKREVLPFKEQP